MFSSLLSLKQHLADVKFLCSVNQHLSDVKFLCPVNSDALRHPQAILTLHQWRSTDYRCMIMSMFGM